MKEKTYNTPLVICGEQDKAGDTKKFNHRWMKQTGLPIHWISRAGHNSNTDQPEVVNQLIQEMINTVTEN